MKRKIMTGICLFLIVIAGMPPPNLYAGGSGGEPLISDEVGWGIVAGLVIIGVYAVYKMRKPMQPPANPQVKDDAATGNSVSDIVSPRGDLIIAKW